MTAVIDFWHRLVDTDGYLPHAVCLDYGPMIWVHALADGIVALSYYSIPFALAVFAWRRRDLRFRWIFVMFGVFILACGTTHLMDVWTLFHPDYALAAAFKVVTAVASLVTAIALWPLLPKALALPSPGQLAGANMALRHQIDERERAEAMVRDVNVALEQRVHQRTRELEIANANLRSEIRQRQAVEEQLRRAKDEADRANLAKSRFLASASHDLRQPTQAMFYFIEALTHRVTDEIGTRVLADLGRALTGMKVLLDSLLDMSRLEAQTIVPHPQDFPIGELLQRVASEFGPAAAEKGLRLRVVPSRAVVHSDPTLLTRILHNLVSNAVRYTCEGRVLVGCRRHSGAVVIEVRDTGIGIPPDRVSEIFEEFTQLGGSDAPRGQGLGLGLAPSSVAWGGCSAMPSTSAPSPARARCSPSPCRPAAARRARRRDHGARRGRRRSPASLRVSHRPWPDPRGTKIAVIARRVAPWRSRGRAAGPWIASPAARNDGSFLPSVAKPSSLSAAAGRHAGPARKPPG